MLVSEVGRRGVGRKRPTQELRVAAREARARQLVTVCTVRVVDCAHGAQSHAVVLVERNVILLRCPLRRERHGGGRHGEGLARLQVHGDDHVSGLRVLRTRGSRSVRIDISGGPTGQRVAYARDAIGRRHRNQRVGTLLLRDGLALAIGRTSAVRPNTVTGLERNVERVGHVVDGQHGGTVTSHLSCGHAVHHSAVGKLDGAVHIGDARVAREHRMGAVALAVPDNHGVGFGLEHLAVALAERQQAAVARHADVFHGEFRGRVRHVDELQMRGLIAIDVRRRHGDYRVALLVDDVDGLAVLVDELVHGNVLGLVNRLARVIDRLGVVVYGHIDRVAVPVEHRVAVLVSLLLVHRVAVFVDLLLEHRIAIGVTHLLVNRVAVGINHLLVYRLVQVVNRVAVFVEHQVAAFVNQLLEYRVTVCIDFLLEQRVAVLVGGLLVFRLVHRFGHVVDWLAELVVDRIALRIDLLLVYRVAVGVAHLLVERHHNGNHLGLEHRVAVGIPFDVAELIALRLIHQATVGVALLLVHRVAVFVEQLHEDWVALLVDLLLPHRVTVRIDLLFPHQVAVFVDLLAFADLRVGVARVIMRIGHVLIGSVWVGVGVGHGRALFGEHLVRHAVNYLVVADRISRFGNGAPHGIQRGSCRRHEEFQVINADEHVLEHVRLAAFLAGGVEHANRHHMNDARISVFVTRQLGQRLLSVQVLLEVRSDRNGFLTLGERALGTVGPADQHVTRTIHAVAVRQAQRFLGHVLAGLLALLVSAVVIGSRAPFAQTKLQDQFHIGLGLVVQVEHQRAVAFDALLIDIGGVLVASRIGDMIDVIVTEQVSGVLSSMTIIGRVDVHVGNLRLDYLDDGLLHQAIARDAPVLNRVLRARPRGLVVQVQNHGEVAADVVVRLRLVRILGGNAMAFGVERLGDVTMAHVLVAGHVGVVMRPPRRVGAQLVKVLVRVSLHIGHAVIRNNADGLCFAVALHLPTNHLVARIVVCLPQGVQRDGLVAGTKAGDFQRVGAQRVRERLAAGAPRAAIVNGQRVHNGPRRQTRGLVGGLVFAVDSR